MLSQPATKIFLKTSEPRAARWVSEAIGEVEIERLRETHYEGQRAEKNFALDRQTEPLVLPSEISGLQPLRAFIKQENRVVPVIFRLTKKRSRQTEFVERTVPQSAPRPSQQALTPPVPKRSQKTPIAVQSPLPIGEASSAVIKTKEGFIWDESQGIE